MKKDLFELDPAKLKDIALTLKARIGEGLQKEGQELLCIPTYINPRRDVKDEKVLVLDLGGTNCRVAVVEFKGGQTTIHPRDGYKKDLSKIMKAPTCTAEQLFEEIANLIEPLDLTGVNSIGYCFSYPAGSTLNGDATLMRWTKGVNIKEMIDRPIGEDLMKYLNKHPKLKADFKQIKVVNDTVASLFAGLTDTAAEAYIGLIVGTGNNMAAFFPTEALPKLDPGYTQKGLISVNLESGNFRPPHLSPVDEKIDAGSDVPGLQRFEKAISGMYLGSILENVFEGYHFEADFNAASITRIMSYPDIYKPEVVEWARLIYERSAKLVAASLAGLILEMLAHQPSIRRIRLTAEGSLFWSGDRKDGGTRFTSYKDQTMTCLSDLLAAFGHTDVKVAVEEQDNANLVGSALAGLS